jgi:hypothetical protein
MVEIRLETRWGVSSRQFGPVRLIDSEVALQPAWQDPCGRSVARVEVSRPARVRGHERGDGQARRDTADNVTHRESVGGRPGSWLRYRFQRGCHEAGGVATPRPIPNAIRANTSRTGSTLVPSTVPDRSCWRSRCHPCPSNWISGTRLRRPPRLAGLQARSSATQRVRFGGSQLQGPKRPRLREQSRVSRTWGRGRQASWQSATFTIRLFPLWSLIRPERGCPTSIATRSTVMRMVRGVTGGPSSPVFGLRWPVSWGPRSGPVVHAGHLRVRCSRRASWSRRVWFSADRRVRVLGIGGFGVANIAAGVALRRRCEVMEHARTVLYLASQPLDITRSTRAAFLTGLCDPTSGVWCLPTRGSCHHRHAGGRR